jgi:hypothetical protein
MNGRWLDLLAPMSIIAMGLGLIMLGVAHYMWWIV